MFDVRRLKFDRCLAALLLTALVGFFFATSALAAEPTVTAVLTSSETVVGRPVQLQIKVTGASGAKMPDSIAVDGLEIHQTGTSREFHMNGFSTSSSIVWPAHT